MPKDVRRWDTPANIPMAHVLFPTGSLGITRPVESLPEGWTMHTHPEGKQYYHRDAREPEPTLLLGTNLYEKGKDLCRPLEIVTDSDPRDPVTRKTLEHAHFIARITIAGNNLELSNRVELFLELYPADEPDNHPYAGYYLADHDNQTIFWGAPTIKNDLCAHSVNPEAFSDHHLKLQLSQQYWSHVEMYPLDASINLQAASDNLTEHLSFMYIDIGTSHTSTSPCTEQQCQVFLSMIHHTPRERKTWMVARLTALTMHWQFQNLFGHHASRLDRTHFCEVEVPAITLRDRLPTIYHSSIAILLRICCVLLFDALPVHTDALEQVWVDKIVYKRRFQYLIDRTVMAWGYVSLLSTVLWTANMAFLAIPYPILTPQLLEPVTDFENTLQIAMITASLSFMVFSVGSIAISLLHIRKRRIERTAQEYWDFLQGEHHHLYGHRPLAMLWSLPYAFLMWSVATVHWQFRNLFSHRFDSTHSYKHLAGRFNEPERQRKLAKILVYRFRPDDLDEAIKSQQAAVDLTPAGDSEKPERLSVLGGLLLRRFECEGSPDDLDEAIKSQQAAVDLTPAVDSEKPGRLSILGGLLLRHFEREGSPDDLDEAIKSQQAAVDLAPAGDPENPERLRVLGELLMRRFESGGALDDLDRVIWIHRLTAVLTPVHGYETSERSRDLESLLERRLQLVGDRNSERTSSLRASVTVPTTLGGAENLYEIVKDKLFEDLQQLSICIKKSKHQELVTTIRRMENAILCLKIQDGDKLCQDIFKASARLGAYCQALRNRTGNGTNQEELENLYKEFVRIEREFSAAHDRISAKYEQLYKQWKAERQRISKFLSKVDPNKSQSDNQEVYALVEQVDAGFERMSAVLKKEANDRKDLSENLNRLARHPRLVHLSPDPPGISSDPAQVPPQPPNSPSTPLNLSKQVEDATETFSRFDALVEKSRYTKARKIISEKSSKTTQRLKKLRASSEDYDQESLSLSCLRTRHNNHSRDIYKRQLEHCNLLLNLVVGMQRMLKAIEKGFNGCKASLPGLVFRSLGDLLCELEPYLPRAGMEVSSKGLHPDLILYEAAFQAIADSIPAQSKLLEGIKSSLSVLDKLRGV